ncbi:putative glycerophosphoryl diester phosphodiesterase 1 [Corynebacterium ciconiae DSM 44920]|uniref:glycerophosphodiester phosphodiesterase family protein n=1 Tax=Corynebacterium ciconiae TaxID=227319 RepID=UPI0003682D9C|nr:glycerophosphodiester phosphodiesterase family protein [Corynebacterium ciconiae]WKD60217.1 putative glycerophosphoryl diester phosphodiesterase 1 [Corynebacterium ciconiae DSM 44920]
MFVIAHRGASADYPELTATAFTEAFLQGADGVECDVRLTRCGELVCIHDPIVDRVSDGRGRVSTHTVEQLREYNFGTEEAPSAPCTLDELLDIMDDHPDKHLFIESKHPMRYGRMLEEELVKTLRYRGLLADPHIHVISFSGSAIHRIQQLAPALDRIYLRNDPNAWYHRIRELTIQPTAVGLSMRTAREHIRDHTLPPSSYVWTVDDPEDMTLCRDSGVQWLATNLPALAREVVDRGTGH